MVALNSMSMEYGITRKTIRHTSFAPLLTHKPKDKMEVEIVGDYGDYVRALLIEGECVENILPNSCCFTDVTTKMH